MKIISKLLEGMHTYGQSFTRIILLSLILSACGGVRTHSVDSTDSVAHDQTNTTDLELRKEEQEAADWKDKRFLKASCGDPLPSDGNVYPVKLYPVFVNFSSADLNKVKTYFCEDAYKVKRDKTGGMAIQVGSFVGMENAEVFRGFMQRKLGASEIGEATVIEKHPSSELLETSQSVEAVENNSSVAANVKLFEDAGVSNEQASTLTSLDGRRFPGRGKDNVFKVVLPKYVPAGFYLEDFEHKVKTKNAVGKDEIYLSYTLTYNNQNNQCFGLNVSTEMGGGEAMYQDNVDAISPDLGRFRLAYTEFDREFESSVVNSGLTSFNGIAHFFTSPKWKEHLNCKGIGVAESVKVVESLTLLNP